jgi:hypothetical protein
MPQPSTRRPELGHAMLDGGIGQTEHVQRPTCHQAFMYRHRPHGLMARQHASPIPHPGTCCVPPLSLPPTCPRNGSSTTPNEVDSATPRQRAGKQKTCLHGRLRSSRRAAAVPSKNTSVAHYISKKLADAVNTHDSTRILGLLGAPADGDSADGKQSLPAFPGGSYNSMSLP